MHVVYNASNNRQTGDSADANGNILYNGSSSTIYDIDNRMVQPGGTTADYAYDAGNKRVWRGDTSPNPATDEVAFWAGNQKLATYQIYTYSVGGYLQLSYNLKTTRVYFGGKLVSQGTYNSGLTLVPVAQDRLGSIGKFYPYGQERPSATQNDTEKFTGYYRDASTGLDYADQRYEQSGVGRFMTPDPYQASVGPSDPGSWNRYAYVAGDPVNLVDPAGLVGEVPRESTNDGSTLNHPTTCYGIGGDLTNNGAFVGTTVSSGPCPPGPGIYVNVPYTIVCADTDPVETFSSTNVGPGSPCLDAPKFQPVAGQKCPPNIQAFFDDFWGEFQRIAGAIGSSTETIAAFAAWESDWGNSAHRANHNLVSELESTDGQKSFHMIAWDSFGNEERYVIRHLGAPKNRRGARDITDPTEFANQLVNIGWSADPRAAYVAGFDVRYGQVLAWEPICLH